MAGRYGRERNAATVQFGAPGENGASRTTDTIKSDAAVHFLARPGFAIHDTMVFLQAGFGVSHMEFKRDVAAIGPPCGSGPFALGCVASFTPSSNSRWHPSVIVGTGFEQNFGSYFARAVAEFEAILPTGDAIWIARAKGMVGARF